jgi:DNA-directed RNA polymerase subunit P
MSEENFEESLSEEKFNVFYKCMRCGHETPLEELSRLPEIKCICGFRVFTKKRPGLVRNVKAI